MNWTNKVNRKDLSLLSEEIITDLINNFSDNSIPLFRKNNFTKYDIGLIYRWPLYIITNIFLERLVRAKYSNKLNPEYISDVCNFEYKIDTVQVALDFYNNESLPCIFLRKDNNYSLLLTSNELNNSENLDNLIDLIKKKLFN